MRGWTRRVSAVIGRILMLGFGVQILLGTVWALMHLGYFQEFPESHFLEKVGKTLICDEYTGILYPLLIRVFQGVGKVVPIPYFSMLYCLHLVVAAYTAWYFLNSFALVQKASLFKKLWALCAILTLPMAMQCHLAVLPVSLATSVFLVQLGILERNLGRGREDARKEGAGKKENKKEKKEQRFRRTLQTLAALGAWGLVGGVLLPEYRFFDALLLLFYAIIEILRLGGMPAGGHDGAGSESLGTDKSSGNAQEKAEDLQGVVRRMVLIVLLAAAFLGINGGLSRCFTQEGAYGRMQNTPEAAGFRRFAWDDFGEFYSEWPEELRETLTQDEIWLCNRYPLQKEWILGQKVDGVYGRERAREIYAEVMAYTGKVRFGRNMREILKDLACYALSPTAQLWLMEGRGQTTLSGRNLDVMRANAPVLTTWYVRYGAVWFTAAVILSLCLWAERFYMAENAARKKWLKQTILYAAILGIIIFWHTMQGGGIMDYKNSLIVTVLWGIWSCKATL